MDQARVAVERIGKRFPGVQALADVSLEFRPGECHALIGENGAGKSTLGKIIAGIHRPDEGAVRVDGRRVTFRTPREAARAGIRIVHQELAFCPNLSIAENLFLGELPSRRGWLDRAALQKQAEEQLATIGLSLDPRTRMETLSTAQEQMVQIAAAAGRRARLIILDEPTSSLSQAEADRLFAILRRLREAGTAIIYVSHRLEEILALSDRISVLRDGRLVGTRERRDATPAELVRLMIGREIEEYAPRHVPGTLGETALAVRDLESAGRFSRVSFDVRRGEIVGMAGLVGAGRSEIAQALFGIDQSARGRVEALGRRVEGRSPSAAISAGIGYLPEDRKRQGLVLELKSRENISLPSLDRLRRAGLVQRGRERKLTTEHVEQLHMRPSDAEKTVSGLSGGNQQKVALAKWLARRCPVLILDEPTRGVDVGAKAEIHALIDSLASAGHAILLISSEMPELLRLSTRILVVSRGRIAGELTQAEATQERVMELMAGGQVIAQGNAAGGT